MQFDLFTFLASLFNFLVLVALLRVFLFKRVTAAMDAREERIATNWDEAEEEKHEAEQLRSDYEQRMEEIDEERDRMLRETRDELEREKRKRLEELRAEVDAKRGEWFRGLRNEKERLVATIRSEVARATVESTEAALRALAGASLERQIVSHLIAELDTQADGLQEQIDGHEVEVTTSEELSEEDAGRLRSRIEEIGSPSSVTFSNSDRVVCGVRLRLGDRELGWSIADHLAELETDLSDLVEAK